MSLETLKESLCGTPVIGLIVRAALKDRDDHAKDMAASIAYFSFFSLFPLFLGVVAFHEGDQEGARQALERARAAGVDQGTLHLYSGLLQFDAGAREEAIREIVMNPDGLGDFTGMTLEQLRQECPRLAPDATLGYPWWRIPHETEEDVSVEAVLTVLRNNVARAQEILRSAVKRIPEERDCHCARALENAIITDSECIPASVKKDLDILIGKYL